MIAGTVTEGLDAVIPLVVRSLGGFEESIDAVLDTGINEFLTLPPSLTTLLGLQRRGAMQVTLGDGRSAQLPYFPASVIWDGRERTIIVMEAEGIPLAGMKLIEGCRLTVDVVGGGAVTIESLP